ncbi:MAG: T9SS type A sorting domain-containing protein [Bacteroidota bacterium]|nr:T9SS type A sorting domain-containing protein [Bacteroidota bacterium]MDP4234255.1 T9SS type A sorting domain-containing protein [Bacteroidota bacterium]MDP4243445.1 T9SS type A sorting domain-containing protein [Bacteroidota bacterium]MDP4288144.1 T9SS type A sorting domain-containing protein [Bacteroidota bacterium]
MKRSIAFFLGFIFLPSVVLAQTPSGVTITQHHRDRQAITSRDYWVALPENYGPDGAGSKYIMLYISSSYPTTAKVAYAGTTTQVAVTPGTPAVFNVPLSLEMQSSDVIESKAIHVWSDDAPLFVDLNQHEAYTSDATYVIPSIGWGTSYVVASYGSLYEGFGSYVYDMPSEFVVLANQDGTSVRITPSTDLRGSTGTTVAHPKGLPFTIQLNAGETVQYKAVAATNMDDFDVTGTSIVSSKPIGVIGATECANIPGNFPYCDYICEMIPPTRTWGTNYYTAPLARRKGGDTYLVIGTTANQIIYRTDSFGQSVFDTLVNPNDHYFQHDVATAGSWTSSTPFLLMQYSNSATWPDNTNGNYDPFMMAVNSTDQFVTPVIFNVLRATGNQQQYVWHVTIVARSGVPVNLDGTKLTGPIYDDNVCAIYQVNGLAPKQHIVTSDSGVAVNVYGDSYDEAVGYAGTIGVSTIGSADTLIPMVVAVSPDPAVTHVDVSDESTNMSGLSQFEVDSMSNMKIVEPDSFVEGDGQAQSSFDLIVLDRTKAAHATVRVLDLAGNYSTIQKDYVANSADVATAPVPSMTSISSTAVTQTIHYSLAKDGYVTIDLFDMLGHRVFSLLSGEQSAGTHALTPDVRLLPSGVYLYRVESQGIVTSGRLSVSH